MNEVEMTLEDLRVNFGDEVANECEDMKENEIKEFYVATYGEIVIRYEDDLYYVSGENVLEEELELELELDDGLDW